MRKSDVAARYGGEEMKDFVKRVDDALYKAKELGRNQVCYG